MNEKLFDWLTHQGPGYVLACFLVWVTVDRISNGLDSVAEEVRSMGTEVKELKYHTVKGSWRETEPPPPSELKEAEIKP